MTVSSPFRRQPKLFNARTEVVGLALVALALLSASSTSAGTGVLAWDGTEGNATLNPIGRGGVAGPLVTADMSDSLAVDVNSNGLANPGDTILYTVVLTNTGSQNASGVGFSSLVDAGTDLVVGSVTTTQGPVASGNTAGDTSVGVDVGVLAGVGGSVTITFRARIHDLFAGTQVQAQGTVTGTNIPSTPTNDPATGAAGDPTITAVSAAPSVIEIPTLGGTGFAALTALLALCGAWLLRRAGAEADTR